MRITTKKIAVAAAATAVLALGAGGAYAYFTSTGSGSGTAVVGTATPWAVSVSPVGGTPLFPGSGTNTFTYSVTNNSSGPVNLNSVVATIDSNADGDVGAAGCEAAWFTIEIAGEPAGPVLPGESNDGTGTIVLNETGENQDACQGTTPGFTLTAS